MKLKKQKPDCYLKYVELQQYGLTPTFFANELNSKGLRRKTNSPYVASTITYTVNGHQTDANVVNIINETYNQKISRSKLSA